LLELGAERVPHSRRTLYEHLCGVERILTAWKLPREVCLAGLFHSIYSTERFRYATLPFTERARVQHRIGERAERLAYLFGILRREAILEQAGLHGPLTADVSVGLPCHWNYELLVTVAGDEIATLVLLCLANRIEQATKPATGAGFWMAWAGAQCARLAAAGVTLPRPLAPLPSISIADERALQSFYFQALTFIRDGDLDRALEYLDRACSGSQVAGEPYLVRAFVKRALCAESTADVERGLELLAAWGSPWHKRLSFEAWQAIGVSINAGAPADAIRAALEPIFRSEDVNAAEQTHVPADGTSADAARFFAYLEGIRRTRSERTARWYPGLERTAWHEAAAFPLTVELEEHYAEIRTEALGVPLELYHEEAEQIGRTGSWQVAMFYEQGRRNDVICERCPSIAEILERHESVRRSAGLIYLSRMAAHTHVVAHQASSNLRLRCHLGVAIPEGDCAIRVGSEIRHWTEGKCLVFDDTFEHEVWNRTNSERLVLLVDLWHPGLSDRERGSLEAINWLGVSRANSIAQTWRRNEAARGDTAKRLLLSGD
jgi:hypothetical protein